MKLNENTFLVIGHTAIALFFVANYFNNLQAMKYFVLSAAVCLFVVEGILELPMFIKKNKIALSEALIRMQ